MRSGFLLHGGFDTAFGLLNHPVLDPRGKPEDDTYVIVGLAPTIFLTPRILSRVSNSLRLVISNLVYCYADVLEYFEELLAKVAECNGTVVWIVLFDEYVAVEAAHFWNCENTDTTE